MLTDVETAFGAEPVSFFIDINGPSKSNRDLAGHARVALNCTTAHLDDMLDVYKTTGTAATRKPIRHIKRQSIQVAGGPPETHIKFQSHG